MDVNWLTAILTSSAFTLIGPDVGYAGVCTQAENCVLGRCVCVVFLCITTSTFFHFSLKAGQMGNFIFIRIS